MLVQFILTYRDYEFEQDIFDCEIPNFTNDTDFLGHLFSSMKRKHVESLEVISTCWYGQNNPSNVYPEFLKNRGGKYVFLPSTKDNRLKAKWLRRRDRRRATRKTSHQPGDVPIPVPKAPTFTCSVTRVTYTAVPEGWIKYGPIEGSFEVV